MTDYEQALAAVEAVKQEQADWTQKRQALINQRAALEAGAGRAALDGASTTKVAQQLIQLGAEVTIADQALRLLEGRLQEAEAAVRLARITDNRRRIVELLRQAEAIEVQAAPHLEALKAIEGVEFSGPGRRSGGLRYQADRLLINMEDLEFKLPEPVRAQLLVQREINPTEIDRAVFAFQYPGAAKEQTT
jgi:hypothetical protein